MQSSQYEEKDESDFFDVFGSFHRDFFILRHWDYTV